MRISHKYLYINICKTVTKYVFLITHAFEIGTIMVASLIYGSKNYVLVGNLTSSEKKGNIREGRFFLYVGFRNNNQVKE